MLSAEQCLQPEVLYERAWDSSQSLAEGLEFLSPIFQLDETKVRHSALKPAVSHAGWEQPLQALRTEGPSLPICPPRVEVGNSWRALGVLGKERNKQWAA